METKHTPGIWVADYQVVFAGEYPAPEICRCHKDAVGMGRQSIPRSEAIANAARIVECVNAHDALVARVAELEAALTDVLLHERGIVMLFNQMGEASPAIFSVACERGRAAIAKVRG